MSIEATLDPYKILYQNELKEILKELIEECLTDREKVCINLYFLSPNKHTLASIAKIYKVTRERVRQILNKGVKKLRINMTGKFHELVPDYLINESHEIPSTIKKSYPQKRPKKQQLPNISNDKIVIFDIDSDEIKFQKYLLKWPHLSKFDWRDKEEINIPVFRNSLFYLVFIPKSSNFLYQVSNLSINQDDIYKWAKY